MARSLDQEPNLSASDNSQPNHGPHPERVSTDFGGSTPAHPDWRPNPLDVQPKNRNKLAALIAIGGVAATGVIGAATYFGLRDAGRDFGNRLTGADAANSAPELPGQGSPEHKTTIDIDAATPDQFYSDANFTDEQRVDWAWNKVNQPSRLPGNEGMTLLQVGYKEIISRNNLTPEKSNGIYKPFFDQVQPSERMTGDQILALTSAIEKVAVSSELSGSDREKVLAAEATADSPNMSRARLAARTQDTSHMGGTQQVIVDQSTGKKVESPIFRQYQPENGYKPSGIPSKIMTTLENSSGQYNQIITQFIHDKPIIVDVYSGDNTSKLVPNPEQIPQNS